MVDLEQERDIDREDIRVLIENLDAQELKIGSKLYFIREKLYGILRRM